MLFNSVGFAIFAPLTVIVYLIFDKEPGRHKIANIWLLIASYFYYMCADVRFGALLFFVTLLTYFAGMGAGDLRKSLSARKAACFCGIVLNIGILFFFKYFNLLSSLIRSDSAMKIVLPVGISFYVFQSLTYVIDSYTGKQAPTRDFLKYALFVSFFPVLLAGPIERSVNLLPQFEERHTFDYERIRHGLLKMASGYFMKLVIAARLSIAVDLIYDNYMDVNGFQLLLATVLYAFQIYCDFASYSSIAVGVGELMGFKLTENFRQPFFSKSCAELWRRWHISLNDWFKNYVYFPLGGSRKGSVRKYLNIMVVFTLSGMWHGAALHYVIWGMLSGLFQVLGEVLMPVRKRVFAFAQPGKGKSVKAVDALRVVGTFILFVIALFFFRADSAGAALYIIKKVLTDTGISQILATPLSGLGLGVYNLVFLAFAMVLLLIYDLVNEKTGDAIKAIEGQRTLIRWGIYYLIVIMLIMSASIGAKKFIYFEF